MLINNKIQLATKLGFGSCDTTIQTIPVPVN